MNNVVFWIDIERQRLWRIFSDEAIEEKKVLLTTDGTFHELIEELTEEFFPKREQVRNPGHNDSLDLSFGKNLFDIAEIGIGADDRFGT